MMMNESMPRLILASASPRRQQLLREAGYEFVVQASGVDEGGVGVNLMPAELARRLAVQKGRAVAQQFPEAVILAADTVVAFGDRTLGKPADAAEARKMLQLLGGTTHLVITGVAVMCEAAGLWQTRTVMSAVRMRKLRPDEIEAYVASQQWQGKAGGYGIQDEDPFVMNQAGSQSNIVGLPMEATVELLAEAGVFPRA
jgi:septum formation protein